MQSNHKHILQQKPFHRMSSPFIARAGKNNFIYQSIFLGVVCVCSHGID